MSSNFSFGKKPEGGGGFEMKYLLYGFLIVLAVALPFFITWFIRKDYHEVAGEKLSSAGSKIKNKLTDGLDNMSCTNIKRKVCSPDYCSLDDRISASFKNKYNAAKAKFGDLKLKAIDFKGDVLTELGDLGTELKDTLGDIAKFVAIVIILIIKLFGDTGISLANTLKSKVKSWNGDVKGLMEDLEYEMAKIETDIKEFPEIKTQLPKLQQELEYEFENFTGDVTLLKPKVKKIFADIPRVSVGFQVRIDEDTVYTATLGMPQLGNYYKDFKDKLATIRYKVGKWDDSMLDQMGSLKFTLQDKYQSLSGEMGRFMLLVRKKFPSLDNIELIDLMGERIGILTGDIDGLMNEINLNLEGWKYDANVLPELHSKLIGKIKEFKGDAGELKASIKNWFASLPRVKVDVDIDVE